VTFTGSLSNTATVTAANEPAARQNQKASATVALAAFGFISGHVFVDTTATRTRQQRPATAPRRSPVRHMAAPPRWPRPARIKAQLRFYHLTAGTYTPPAGPAQRLDPDRSARTHPGTSGFVSTGNNSLEFQLVSLSARCSTMSTATARSTRAMRALRPRPCNWSTAPTRWCKRSKRSTGRLHVHGRRSGSYSIRDVLPAGVILTTNTT